MDKSRQDVDADIVNLLPWQEQVIALWGEGKLQKDIAHKVGKSVRTVNRFLRSEAGLRMSRKLRGIQWDQLTSKCATGAVTLFERVNRLMESTEDNAALRACALMRQLIRDSLEFDMGARLAEVENRLAELEA